MFQTKSRRLGMPGSFMAASNLTSKMQTGAHLSLLLCFVVASFLCPAHGATTNLSGDAKRNTGTVGMELSGIVKSQRPHGFLVKMSTGSEVFLLTVATHKPNESIRALVAYPVGYYSYPINDTGDVAKVPRLTDDVGVAADYSLKRGIGPAAASPLSPEAEVGIRSESKIDTEVGAHIDNLPAARSTELSRYKAMVYRAIGSRWYPKVDRVYRLLPEKLVHIQFTIHKDGTLVETKVLEGNTADLQLLLSISLNSIREASPFPPFTDSMIREVGDSYKDDFFFSIAPPAR